VECRRDFSAAPNQGGQKKLGIAIPHKSAAPRRGAGKGPHASKNTEATKPKTTAWGGPSGLLPAPDSADGQIRRPVGGGPQKQLGLETGIFHCHWTPKKAPGSWGGGKAYASVLQKKKSQVDTAGLFPTHRGPLPAFPFFFKVGHGGTNGLVKGGRRLNMGPGAGLAGGRCRVVTLKRPQFKPGRVAAGVKGGLSGRGLQLCDNRDGE